MSRDRCFLWFAGAFATSGISGSLLVYDEYASGHTSYIYAVRMLGFLKILAAIQLKNRRQRM